MSTWRCLDALAGHRDHPPGQVQVADVEAAQLGHPQPAAVEQLEHGVVPTVHFGRSGVRGEPWPARAARPISPWPRTRGRRESGEGADSRVEGSLGDQPPPGTPLEVGAQGGRRAGDGGLRVAAGGQEGQVAAQHDPVDLGRDRRPRPAGPLGEALDIRWSRPAPTPGTARPPSVGTPRSPRSPTQSTGAIGPSRGTRPHLG